MKVSQAYPHIAALTGDTYPVLRLSPSELDHLRATARLLASVRAQLESESLNDIEVGRIEAGITEIIESRGEWRVGP